VFDGSQSSTSAVASPNQTLTDFTISTPVFVSSTNTLPCFWKMGPSSTTGDVAPSAFLYIASGVLTLDYSSTSYGNDRYRYAVSGFQTAYADKIVWLTVSRSGSTTKIYANGVDLGATGTLINSGSASMAITATYLTLGTFNGSGTNQTGFESLVGLYNRALSAAEVVALYEAGVPDKADYPSTAAGTALTKTLSLGTWTGSVAGSTFTVSTASTGFIYGQVVSAGTVPKGKIQVNYDLTINSGPGPAFGDGNTFTSSTLAAGTGKTIELTNPVSGNLLYLVNGYAAGNYVVTINSVTPLGLLLAPDAGQAGGGLTWYDTSGNAANITLPASGVTWNVPSSRYLGGNWTTSGNLTVSGTGLSSVTGGLKVQSLEAVGTPASYNSTGGLILAGYAGSSYALVKAYSDASGTEKPLALQTGSGNLLLGTTTDAGGKLQIATGANKTLLIGNDATYSSYNQIAFNGVRTNNATLGIIGGGTGDDKLYLLAPSGGELLFQVAAVTKLQVNASGNATFAGAVTATGKVVAQGINSELMGDPTTTGSLILIQKYSDVFGAGTVGSCIDVLNSAKNARTPLGFNASSYNFGTGNATFAGNLTVSGTVQLGNAYVAGAPTATGYVTIKDSAGNTYKVLVGT
jgi:hypothetical protein